MIDELNAWEQDVLYPLATRRVEIDLDDGVKVNYAKFSDALKKMPGFSMNNQEARCVSKKLMLTPAILRGGTACLSLQ